MLLVNFFGSCLRLNFSLFSCRNFRTLFLSPHEGLDNAVRGPVVGHGQGPTSSFLQGYPFL